MEPNWFPALAFSPLLQVKIWVLLTRSGHRLASMAWIWTCASLLCATNSKLWTELLNAEGCACHRADGILHACQAPLQVCEVWKQALGFDVVGPGWIGLDRWIFFAANFKNGLRFACAFCISGMGLSHTRGLGWWHGLKAFNTVQHPSTPFNVSCFSHLWQKFLAWSWVTAVHCCSHLLGRYFLLPFSKHALNLLFWGELFWQLRLGASSQRAFTCWVCCSLSPNYSKAHMPHFRMSRFEGKTQNFVYICE